MVVGCATAILGKHMIFRFLPAVAVLIFLIPVPGMLRQRIALPLENWTAQISQLAFGLIGVMVERRQSTQPQQSSRQHCRGVQRIAHGFCGSC